MSIEDPISKNKYMIFSLHIGTERHTDLFDSQSFQCIFLKIFFSSAVRPYVTARPETSNAAQRDSTQTTHPDGTLSMNSLLTALTIHLCPRPREQLTEHLLNKLNEKLKVSDNGKLTMAATALSVNCCPENARSVGWHSRLEVDGGDVVRIEKAMNAKPLNDATLPPIADRVVIDDPCHRCPNIPLHWCPGPHRTSRSFHWCDCAKPRGMHQLQFIT